MIYCGLLKSLDSAGTAYISSEYFKFYVKYIDGQLAFCYDKLLEHFRWELGELVHKLLQGDWTQKTCRQDQTF